MVEISPDLKFVELAPLFRTIGKDKIPSWATNEGYNPDVHRQIAIFGDEEELDLFRKENQLDPVKYPIQNSKMGTHLDVYGEKAISTLVPQDRLVDTMTYLRELRK